MKHPYSASLQTGSLAQPSQAQSKIDMGVPPQSGAGYTTIKNKL